jgi:hypothetical protein
MSDKKISDLPAAGTLTGSELIELEQSGGGVRSTAALIAALGGGGSGSGSSSSRMVPLIIFNGESNSGGYADNSEALPSELAPRPSVQILDNIGLASFLDLDIGTNNNVDHLGLSNTSHGWELGLANSVEAGEWYDQTVPRQDRARRLND